jgi:NAD(P)-dependent dehydrogenase (short-subunit alcohol dehydrogenase family)
MSNAGKAVLITGTSTGIGAATARLLAAHGYEVFAGVRRAEDGASLRATAPDRIMPILLDVTQPDLLRDAVDHIASRMGEHGLAGLVNNAGIVVLGPLEYLPLDALRRQFEVNVFGQIAVTQAFLPLLRKAKGRIVFTSSTSGFISAPFIGPYCASKFALEGLIDALRGELRPWGIEVVSIQPGAIATPIWEKSAKSNELLYGTLSAECHRRYDPAIDGMRKQAQYATKRAIPAERIAKTILRALEAPQPRTRYRPGLDAWVQYHFARRVPDRLRDAVVCKVLGLNACGSAE